MNKILLVGCGHMGTALLTSWVKKTNHSFTVIDPKNYISLNRKFKKIETFKSIENLNINIFKKFNIVIFAIKPQISKKVLQKFSNLKFNKNVLFISIVAGKKISFYNNFLPTKSQVVRIMPNMPAILEQSMSCIYFNNKTSKSNKDKTASLFKKVGKILIFKKEIYIDKATAISGSGPGYFFLFISLLENAAKKLGFSSKISEELVLQTALGSIVLLNKSSKNSNKLKNDIAIKGGTTEAAIKNFNYNNLNKIINKSVQAAYNRAKYLSKNL